MTSDPIAVLSASALSLAVGSLIGVLICEVVKNRADRKKQEADRSVETTLAGDLDPYLAGQVRSINEQHSAARVVPLRRPS